MVGDTPRTSEHTRILNTRNTAAFRVDVNFATMRKPFCGSVAVLQALARQSNLEYHSSGFGPAPGHHGLLAETSMPLYMGAIILCSSKS